MASILAAAVAAAYLLSRARQVGRATHRRSEMSEPQRRLFDLERQRTIAVAAMVAFCALGLVFVALSWPLLALASLVLSVLCLIVAAALGLYLGLRGGGRGPL